MYFEVVLTVVVGGEFDSVFQDILLFSNLDLCNATVDPGKAVGLKKLAPEINWGHGLLERILARRRLRCRDE